MDVNSYIINNPQGQADITAINSVFKDFGIQVDEVVVSSQIIRYKMTLPVDVKAHGKLRRANKDIVDTLATALKSNDIIYERSEDYIFIDKKNNTFKPVLFKDIIGGVPKSCGDPLLLLGMDIDGNITYTNLSKAPHILIAGTTGSGKSELLHTFIASLIWRRSVAPIEIVIIDPKHSEYSMYKNKNGVRLITETSEAIDTLEYLVGEMERRYTLFEQHVGVKDIKQLDSVNPIAVIIDELADLMDTDKEVEEYIVRLAQKARACGIHLILGTQTPRANIITGRIKANVPTRIALSTVNSLESRIILDRNGAENLLGKGDMLYLGNGAMTTIRIQSAYVPNDLKQNIADGLSYQEHTPLKVQKTSQDSFAEYCRKNDIDWDSCLEYIHRNDKPQKKGLWRGFFRR